MKPTALVATASLLATGTALAERAFPVPDTAQDVCFDSSAEIACPAPGEAFHCQDARHDGVQPSYTDNGDGTVTDDVTGLMWVKSADLNGDGQITVADKLSYDAAVARADGFVLAGYDDWRLPAIKELYSLMDFRGIDPPPEDTDTSALRPFIDTDYFDFAYGDLEAGERIIDAQFATTNTYVSTTGPNADRTMFGVNFAEGRIKGYGLTLRGRDKLFYVMHVRGEAGYGVNALTDNGDGTVTDATTGLMWAQEDSGDALNWQEALAWVEARIAESHLGHDDWRLPNVKELQSLLDYTRSPDTSVRLRSIPCSKRRRSRTKPVKRIFPSIGVRPPTSARSNRPAAVRPTSISAARWAIWAARGLTCTVPAPSAATPKPAIPAASKQAMDRKATPSASTGTRPAFRSRFSSSVLRCLGAATRLASTICPDIGMSPASRTAASNRANSFSMAPALVSFSRNSRIVRASGTRSSRPSPRKRMKDSRSLIRNSARSSERSFCA